MKLNINIYTDVFNKSNYLYKAIEKSYRWELDYSDNDKIVIYER
jgi:hypothetical protein